MNIPRIQPPEDNIKLKRQIEALEHQIKQDKNDKDRFIHQEALKALKEAWKANNL